MKRRLPTSYVIALCVLVLIAIFVALVSFAIPPFDNLTVFILSQVVGAFTLLVFGVIGGAFVGMIVAHRMLASRDFSPFEREVLEALEDVRARLARLECGEEDENLSRAGRDLVRR